jgi:hypothetical protein
MFAKNIPYSQQHRTTYADPMYRLGREEGEYKLEKEKRVREKLLPAEP